MDIHDRLLSNQLRLCSHDYRVKHVVIYSHLLNHYDHPDNLSLVFKSIMQDMTSFFPAPYHIYARKQTINYNISRAAKKQALVAFPQSKFSRTKESLYMKKLPRGDFSSHLTWTQAVRKHSRSIYTKDHSATHKNP